MNMIEIPITSLSNGNNNNVSILVSETANPSNDDWSSLSTSAIKVDNIYLTYNSQQKPVPVLKNLSMTVPRGSIYGLLGASGCGKTSIIRCILGNLKTSAGDISVFGHNPASSKPGSRVGYMPQDITLYQDLTIKETLRYFASLYGMTRDKLEKRSQFLIDFLHLPDPNRLVRHLSGGQRRRVSLATALIHKPPLLILDEPTVGVDPILRQSIWSYLMELSQSMKLTVLITTHYIEEARNAHQIGLMRNGQMLAEDSPGAMLATYGLPSLESVFLHLCKSCTKSEESRHRSQSFVSFSATLPTLASTKNAFPPNGKTMERRNSGSSSGSSGVVSLQSYDDSKINKSEPVKPVYLSSTSAISKLRPKSISWCSQVGAMLVKNVTAIRRDSTLMLAQFMLPTIQVVLFCSCIGLKLHTIHVAVYDGDQSNFSKSILSNLSLNTIEQTMYSSPEIAIDAVKNGRASLALTISSNFSDSLFTRMASMGMDVSEEIMYNSTIHLFPDMSNRLMVSTVQEEVMNVFLKVGKSYLSENGVDPSVLDMPVQMEDPVYGSKNAIYRDYMSPGTILSIAFLSAIPLTAMVLVVERKDGLIERSIVAGASYFRILIALLIPQIGILFVSSLSLLIFVFFVFGISYQGHFASILLLTFLQSICGMCFGIFVSTLAKDENTATMMTLSFFYPNLLLSGTIWPVEAMATWVQPFAYYLPQTLPIYSLRHIMSRGWSVLQPEVFLGFAVTGSWIVIFLAGSAVVFKLRKL